MPGKKLLVADDSLTIQKVIRLALSNEGYEIQAVSDGNDAAQQISLFHPDVVLIDVSLPGKTAFEVKREINSHEDLNEIRFVLMSSAFEKVDEEQLEEVVFHGTLTKPFDPAHLRQVLTDVLAQVTARRMEKTSLLQRPAPQENLPPPPPSFPPQFFPPPSEMTTESGPPLPPQFPSEFPPEFPSEGATENSHHEFIPSIPPNLPPIPTFPPDQMPEVEHLGEDLKQLWETETEHSEVSITLPPPPSFPEKDDIQTLTESTMNDAGYGNPSENLDDFQWSVSEPSLKPPPAILESFEKESPPLELIPPPPPVTPTPSFSPPLNQEEIERLVKEQVQIALEQMAQKLLPEVAERVIKAEIHRMLSE